MLIFYSLLIMFYLVMKMTADEFCSAILTEIKAHKRSIWNQVHLAIAIEIKRVGEYAQATTEGDKRACIRKGAELVHGRAFKNGQFHMPETFHQKGLCDGVVRNDSHCIVVMPINAFQAFMLPSQVLCYWAFTRG
jgi:hypothetical protein